MSTFMPAGRATPGDLECHALAYPGVGVLLAFTGKRSILSGSSLGGTNHVEPNLWSKSRFDLGPVAVIGRGLHAAGCSTRRL